MTADSAFLIGYVGMLLSALAMGIGTFVIIKLDERPSKPKKK